MAEATNPHSVVLPFVAGGVINPGHAVQISADDTVVQCSGANTGDGIYIGEQDAASGDHVEVCVAGPCRAWVDGAVTVNPGAWLANDADGHIIADTTDRHRLIGRALKTNAAAENFCQVFVNIVESSHA